MMTEEDTRNLLRLQETGTFYVSSRDQLIKIGHERWYYLGYQNMEGIPISESSVALDMLICQ